MIEEASKVVTTNASAERDFGMLDRLMRIKPKALDMVYEGIIMFSTNKTSTWRDKLSHDQLETAMEAARKSKQQQKLLYIKAKKQIFQQKAQRSKDKLEEKERKEKLLTAEKEKLLQQINDYGGLWGKR